MAFFSSILSLLDGKRLRESQHALEVAFAESAASHERLRKSSADLAAAIRVDRANAIHERRQIRALTRQLQASSPIRTTA